VASKIGAWLDIEVTAPQVEARTYVSRETLYHDLFRKSVRAVRFCFWGARVRGGGCCLILLVEECMDVDGLVDKWRQRAFVFFSLAVCPTRRAIPT